MGIGKLALGVVLLLVGLGLFVDSVVPLTGSAPILPISWFMNFVIILTGTIPILLILGGLFLVWIQMDESRAHKELAKVQKQAAPPVEQKK